MRAIKGTYISRRLYHEKVVNDTTRDPVHLVCYRLYGQLRLLSHQNNSSDPAVKQILLSMNEKSSFIIEDLDDHHLVIKADEEYRVRKELEAEVHLDPLLRLLFQTTDKFTSWRRTRTAWKHDSQAYPGIQFGGVS